MGTEEGMEHYWAKIVFVELLYLQRQRLADLCCELAAAVVAVELRRCYAQTMRLEASRPVAWKHYRRYVAEQMKSERHERNCHRHLFHYLGRAMIQVRLQQRQQLAVAPFHVLLAALTYFSKRK